MSSRVVASRKIPQMADNGTVKLYMGAEAKYSGEYRCAEDYDLQTISCGHSPACLSNVHVLVATGSSLYQAPPAAAALFCTGFTMLLLVPVVMLLFLYALIPNCACWRRPMQRGWCCGGCVQ